MITFAPPSSSIEPAQGLYMPARRLLREATHSFQYPRSSSHGTYRAYRLCSYSARGHRLYDVLYSRCRTLLDFTATRSLEMPCVPLSQESLRCLDHRLLLIVVPSCDRVPSPQSDKYDVEQGSSSYGRSLVDAPASSDPLTTDYSQTRQESRRAQPPQCVQRRTKASVCQAALEKRGMCRCTFTGHQIVSVSRTQTIGAVSE